MDDGSAGCLGGLLGCGFFLVFGLGLHLLMSWVLFRVGQKFGIGTFWQWCIPIYNIYLLCQCAEITPLWIIGFFVPIVGLVAGVYLWGVIAARLGKDFWVWGLLCGLLGIPVLVLAFDDSEPVADPVLPFA